MKRFLILILCLSLFSCKKENNLTHDNSYYKIAKRYRDSSATDSAFYYYNLAKNDFLNTSDSLGVGNCLVNMGIIQTKKGDFFGGIESSLEANKFLKKQNDSAYRRALSTNYNNIGLSFHFLKDFEKSSSYYIKTLKYIDSEEDRYLCYNNIGDLLISQGNFNSAKYYLKKAAATKDSNTLSKVINNLAKAKYLSNKNYNPLPEFYQALNIRERRKDALGLNSSFETLSTYYLYKNENLSLSFAEKMLEYASENQSLDDKITALKRIITLDSKNYLQNFQRLDSLNENLQTERNKHKNQFAVVRYDVEQKNAQNQILKTQSFKQIVGIAALAIALISVFFWNEKRKKHIRQEKEKEKELEVKNTELRYSKKVHDVVANGLYHLMIDIENKPEINKVKILNDMEKMYEESRDISHDRITEIDFHERFGKMMNSYYTEEQKVIPIKYVEKIWEKIPQNTQSEMFYVVREILVNMKKHSDAKMVVLKFEREGDALHITYTDNGKGIKNLDSQRGAGIKNTENRIDTIGGDIIFEENPNGGLIIKITIPTHSKYV
ncbi:hypothetical protein PGH12_12075 [Chryseobacterium wangxinyae]|uniref:tetratricopeptide repeat-containing sensor histidine kinase n=1 Tax=Chryseobacterium sp. CY350 TaxID=2997336 RepID=UPI002271EFAB|nr:tetratricopeptide repeat-containing sensor histidine kinase [Chryseobacterium sp. CY350]MCY0976191.1 hypothetical protein [Chryseobacterium sp. CY350]WBZ94211.1 hypothetical protein PGH12_12075 [Chryseobacterium sp. CY350]